jgi:hypothetical protein
MVALTQVEEAKMAGQLAVGKIAIAEINQLSVELVRFQREVTSGI